MPSSSHWRPIKQRRRKKKKEERKSKEAVNNNNSLFLPEEIINNILKRLPVKSLIRYQCVCKLWKTLIKTQSFAHENFHHYSTQNPFILFGDYLPHRLLKLYLLNNDMKIVPLNCASMSHMLHYSVIIGSINGLLCFSLWDSSHGFALWNPSTGHFRLVPKPPNGGNFRFGFGFSSILNDYNILTIDGSMDDLRGQVYSFKTGLWKEVDSSPLKDVTILRGNFATNGSILCVGVKHDVYLGGIEQVLVSYDMASEVFTLIPSHVVPTEQLDPFVTCITMHENKLVILTRTYIEGGVSSSIDMWIMEDGSREGCGWTKKFSISHSSLSFAVTIWRNKIVCLTWPTSAIIGGKLANNERKSIGLVDLTTSKVDIFDIGIYGRPIPFMNHLESLLPIGNNHIEEL